MEQPERGDGVGLTNEEIACSSPAGLAYIHSKGAWTCPPHLAILNQKLLDIAGGRCKRLLVSMPPRHGKSMLISQYFPAWLIGIFPQTKIILASYEANFASSWGAKARDVLTDMRTIFKAVPRDGYNAAASAWETREGGGMTTAGAGGPLTGKGFKVGIVDDLIKNNEEAMSQTIRKKHQDWFQSTFTTRGEPDSAIIAIMTRWHDDDLIGWLEKTQGEQWEVINFPALAEKGDVLGRKEGEALWPDRYPKSKLLELKNDLGSYWWAAMYQQRPTPEGGGIIKREWWKYYSVAPAKIRQSFWSWDTASKTGEENDYSVGQLWAVCDNGYYLLKVVRDRMEYPDLKRAIVNHFNANPSNGVLIEDKTSGQSVIQDLKRDTRLPIIAIEPIKDKVTRCHIASPTIEAGKCFIPENEKWVADYIDEMTHFPKASHDDQVDSTTQFLNYISNRQAINPRTLKAGGRMQTADF